MAILLVIIPFYSFSVDLACYWHMFNVTNGATVHLLLQLLRLILLWDTQHPSWHHTHCPDLLPINMTFRSFSFVRKLQEFCLKKSCLTTYSIYEIWRV